MKHVPLFAQALSQHRSSSDVGDTEAFFDVVEVDVVVDIVLFGVPISVVEVAVVLIIPTDDVVVVTLAAPDDDVLFVLL